MIYAIIAALVLIADQWLKYWVTINITLETGSVPLIPGVIKLVNIRNSGAAFGILDNVPYARWILLGLAAVLCIALIVVIAKRVFPGRFPTWCMVLFMAGALGNCIDRVIYGYVVDMFKLDFVSFAVFNIADIFLVVSCLMFVIYLFVGSKDEEELAAAEEIKKKKSKGKNAAKQDKSDSGASDKEAASVETPTEDDVWNNFKAALHLDVEENADDGEKAVPVPEKPAAPRRRSAIKSQPAVEPVIKEEPLPEVKAERPEEAQDKVSDMPGAADAPAPVQEPAEAAEAQTFTLEEILREFGM